MPTPLKATTTARCTCGRVQIEATGAPILSTACYCDDCQTAARRIQSLPNARPVTDANGGTEYVLFRKDRVRITMGAELLDPQKLVPTSPTTRLVTTCCASPMLLKFDDSKHWANLYRARVVGEPPPLQMRICTKFKVGDGALPTDVAAYAGYTPRFLFKLLSARVAMIFGP